MSSVCIAERPARLVERCAAPSAPRQFRLQRGDGREGAGGQAWEGLAAAQSYTRLPAEALLSAGAESAKRGGPGGD